MPPAVGYPMPDFCLGMYVIITDTLTDGRQSWWYTFEVELDAKHTAMAWMICGFPTRVVKLNYDQSPLNLPAAQPTIPFYFHDLQGVMDLVPGLTKSSNKEMPINPDEGISDADFNAWVISLSNTAPSWPKPTGQVIGPDGRVISPPGQVTKALAEAVPVHIPFLLQMTPLDIHASWVHIESGYGRSTLCGCVGHTQPDHPHMQPLKRGVEYCPRCLQTRTFMQQDYERGWARSQMNSPRMFDQSQGHMLPSAPPLPPLWEDELKPQEIAK